MAMKHRARRKKKRQEREAVLAKQGHVRPANESFRKGISDFIKSQMVTTLGIVKEIEGLRDLQTRVISFKDYAMAGAQQVKENLSCMREATESNNAGLVARLLERILELNTELEIKQKPVLKAINDFCAAPKPVLFPLVSGIICGEEIESVRKNWDIVADLAEEIDKDYTKTMMMAQEYFETQNLEQQLEIGRHYMVPDDVSIS